MKTFEELKAFIELKATEYEAVDEGETYENLWECELIDNRHSAPIKSNFGFKI